MQTVESLAARDLFESANARLIMVPIVKNALSFDIEDWFHMLEIPAVADPQGWDQMSSIVVEKTEWILNQLEMHQVQATFFVLGWVAEKYPQLVRQIHQQGHEIASHAFWHRRVDQLSRQEFREELQRSIDTLQQQTGAKVFGFRAPSFSITPGSEWALDLLLDAGIEYDASLFPAKRGHGGYPCTPAPHKFSQLPSGRNIPELPMSIMKMGPLRIPFSGGGYLRLLPLWAIRFGFWATHRAGSARGRLSTST